MCGVDDFKEVNDKYGHEFGDAGLTELAAILKGAAGEGDGWISRRAKPPDAWATFTRRCA